MAVPITINNLDPLSLVASPGRPLAGIVQSGNVTPSDTAHYGDSIFARWLYVGVTGNVTYVKWDGTTQLVENLAAGVFHPICSIAVKSTGTTATKIVWGS